MNAPLLTALDHLITNQESRHAWLYTAGEQVRLMNAREAEGLCIICGEQECFCDRPHKGGY